MPAFSVPGCRPRVPWRPRRQKSQGAPHRPVCFLPQIDGSTLRTLCLQHGPLVTFHLNLTQGNAVVRYSSKEEAAKAQKSLHMCVSAPGAPGGGAG